ncbi:MAG TPA: amidohydrolase family protein [Candidatus Dormibacteraeota bacterium]|jgi:predicted TIM-barrel fold metal-dependent hydrolase|nr:amidohydrolase family protein [Candidatus Dormibacteraeota bacterium]
MAENVPPLVDPHHHLWDLDLMPYEWLRKPPQHPTGTVDIRKTYLLDDLLADAKGLNLVRSVHLEAGADRSNPVAETAWLQKIADERGFPHGIVGFAPLHDPEVGRTLEEHARYPNFRGIRHIMNWDADPARSQCDRPDYMTDPQWLAGYAELERLGMSFDLQAVPFQMRDAAAVAHKHPTVPMIVNHTGMPMDQSPEGHTAWREGMRTLAREPNVSCKISGFGMFDPDWTEASIRPYVLETIELFGVERSMFASNFPVDKAYRPFVETFNVFREIVSGCSAGEQQKLFHDNAIRIYRIDG